MFTFTRRRPRQHTQLASSLDQLSGSQLIGEAQSFIKKNSLHAQFVDAKDFVEDNQGMADTTIRLPEGAAIEVALLRDLEDDVVKQALRDAAYSASVAVPASLEPAIRQPTDRRGTILHKEKLSPRPVRGVPTTWTSSASCHPSLG